MASALWNNWDGPAIRQKLYYCNRNLENGNICRARFDSPIAHMQHLRAIHGYPDNQPLITAVVELQGPNFKGTVYFQHHVFHQLAPYAKDKACVLHVVEFKDYLRIWATEADPSADPNQIVPVKITVPGPRTLDNPPEVCLHQFNGKVLPFRKYGFEDDDPVEYFDVPKNFVQQFYKKRINGGFGLRILFAFGDPDATSLFDENGEAIEILQLHEELDDSSSDDGDD